MKVRIATGADAEAVERIRVRGWQHAYRHVFPTEELDGLEIDSARWQRHLELPPAGWFTFVVEQSGHVVGFVSVGPSRDQRGQGELYALYVDPAAWSTGAGRALIERAEEELAWSYQAATLWVLADNPRARRFYERAGWQPDGMRRVEERLGVRSPEVRYSKRLTSSRSRG